MKFWNKRRILTGLPAVLACIGFACNTNSKPTQYDSPKNGTIYISVDESFKPVIEEQVKVYEASYPGTHIIASYKPEADCFRDLENDSTRMIIVAKGLTEDQEKFFDKKLSYKPPYDILAFDAVCLIVNAASTDSVFTMQRIYNLLSGADTSKYVVADGNKATSTVRYLLDSVLLGKSFGKNVVAASGSRAVIDYVSKDANAIGFVGSSWVTNNDDPMQKAYLKTIRLALLQCKNNCDSFNYAKPSQATITYMQYPLVRPLFYILKEHTNGLGTGFTNYLSLQRGQLVFRRSYLVPAKMDFEIRKSSIH